MARVMAASVVLLLGASWGETAYAATGAEAKAGTGAEVKAASGARAKVGTQVDLGMIAAIRNEGLQASQVMDHLSWVADVYGPRVTGTPQIRAASDWAITRMASWGLTEAHREYFKFGAGWSFSKSAIRMVAPQAMQIIGYPIAWTPGTDGPITAEVVSADLLSGGDLEAWRGKLRGKIVLIQPARVVKPVELPLIHRFTDEELQHLREETPTGAQWLSGEKSDGSRGSLVPTDTHGKGLYGFADTAKNNAWLDKLIAFLKAEGTVAVFERGPDSTERPATSFLEMIASQRTQRIDGGTIQMPMAFNFEMDNKDRLLPWMVLAVEQYNRMSRILEHGLPVRVELDVAVEWYPEPAEGNGFNTFAEIRGSDLARQTVMLGAHLDGVHPATAAVDNGAGVAVVMEAMRILRAVGVKPRRTIRVALWGGEENGLQGSRAYVIRHFGDPFRGPPYNPATKDLSVYFNIDNGSGRIRGLYARNNLGALPVLQHWIKPLEDLGVTTLAPRATLSQISEGGIVSGSDFAWLDAVGIPALDVIQDRLDYFSRTYHTNMDYVDRASKPDLIQAATVFAVLAYEAAMEDEPLPRRAPGPAIAPGPAMAPAPAIAPHAGDAPRR